MSLINLWIGQTQNSAIPFPCWSLLCYLTFVLRAISQVSAHVMVLCASPSGVAFLRGFCQALFSRLWQYCWTSHSPFLYWFKLACVPHLSNFPSRLSANGVCHCSHCRANSGVWGAVETESTCLKALSWGWLEGKVEKRLIQALRMEVACIASPSPLCLRVSHLCFLEGQVKYFWTFSYLTSFQLSTPESNTAIAFWSS